MTQGGKTPLLLLGWDGEMLTTPLPHPPPHPRLPASHQVSYEDVNRLKKFGVLEKARIPHFMQDLERYMKQLDHIVTTNGLNEEELEQLLPD